MQIKSKILFVFILLLFVVTNVTGQNEKNIQFYNLNEEYRISMREANQVCEDNNGFIWISSKMGILRYTRDDIRSYQIPYDSENIVFVRMEYTNNKLYVYTNNGQIFTYNTIRDKFELVTNIPKYLEDPNIAVNRLLVDQSETMWEASSVGLMRYGKESGLNIFLPGVYVQFLEWLDNHRFFYAIAGAIRIFDINTFTSEDYYEFPVDKNFYISNMKYDRDENILWLGTLGDGLYYLDSENGTLQLSTIEGIPNQPILTITSISESTLLLGVDGQGVWGIDKQTKKINTVYKEDSDNQNSLRGNGVYDIFCDRNKRVWISTYSGGVSFFDQADNSLVTKVSHIVNNPNSLVNNDINSVLEDHNGNMWFATNNGISFWNRKTNKWTSLYHNIEQHAQVFITLCEDSNGRIWAGTYSSGIYVLDSQTGKELKHLSREYTDGNFAGDFVFNIMEDSKGDIWIGGVRGDLICYHPSSDTYESYKDYTVYIIQEYGPDKLLLGTVYGLVLFDKNTHQSEMMVEGFVVYDIYLKDNVVWMATNGDGVIRFDIINKTTERYTVETGLPSNFVNSISYAKGYFWIGTEQGLSRLNETDHTILSFNSVLYLNQVSFNQDSHYLLKNGDLMMGTNIGVLMFDPEDLRFTPERGHLYIQDISVSGRSIRDIQDINLQTPIDELEEISLKYFQNTISMELIPIGVNSPGSKFSWMIGGIDQEWSMPGNNRVLSYSNLPAGTYTLKIRMFDNSLIQKIAERSIVIKIIPPFWETFWFRLMLLILIAGIGIILIYFYIDRLKKRHSEEKIKFFANTAHDMRTSLTLISGPIEELNKEPKLSEVGLNYLHLATDQVQHLLKVVTQLMDFQKVDVGKERLSYSTVNIVKAIRDRVMMFEAVAKNRNIEIILNSNMKVYETSVDEWMIEKVVDNLISNAIKYSYNDTLVRVELRCLPSKWILEVQDSGIGISKKAQKMLFREYYRGDNAINSKIVGSGIGLLLVKNYVSMHGGKVTYINPKGQGSTFQVTIPYLNKPAINTNPKSVSRPVQSVYQPGKLTPIVEKVTENVSHKMKVLIVEDHEYLREFLYSAMQDQFNISLAEDGEVAWEIIEKTSPDLVVSDIMMPKMDGFELCEKIKSTFETSHIPVILLTALAEKSQQIHGFGLGADNYLIKPFDITLLQQRIKMLIKNREIVRDRALKMIKIDSGEEPILQNELNDKFIKNLIEVVKVNMDNPQFSKNEFASAMNVSPSLLYKKIKSLTDQSPTDFIKVIRLEHSVELLKAKKYTITEISELCGFASVGYFSTVFRKHYGKSPTHVTE